MTCSITDYTVSICATCKSYFSIGIYKDKLGALCQLVENRSYYLFLEALVTRPDSKEQLQQHD